MNTKLESKRITRWLVSADSSAEKVGVKIIPTSHEDYAEDGHHISNFKWCVREVNRIKKCGAVAYTKKVGKYCAIYSNLTTEDVNNLRELELKESDVEAMIKKDSKLAA